MNKPYSIFSRDYYPGHGGVMYYTHELFLSMKALNVDVGLIVPSNPKEMEGVFLTNIKSNRQLGKRFGDGFFLTRKLNTVNHFRQIRREAGQDIQQYDLKNRNLIVTACYDLETLIFLEECVRSGVNYSIVLHGLDIIRQLNGYSNKWSERFKEVCRKADVLIFNSKATQQFFEEKLWQPSRSVIVYPGLNFDKIDIALNSYQATPKINDLLSADVNILSVGSLVKRKGFDLAIEAFEAIRKDYSNKKINYLIAGDGPEKDTLRKLIEAKNLSDAVFLLGSISDEEKYHLMKKADLFIMPAHTMGGDDFEGFGIVYLEAAYLGCYVIGGNEGGVPEAVPPFPQGKLVEALQAKEIYESTVECIERVVLGQNANINKTWIDKFSWQNQVKKMLQYCN